MGVCHGIRKSIIVVVGLLCLICCYVPMASADLNFGVTLCHPENRIRVSYTPLLDALAQYLDQPVNLVIVENYAQLAQKMASHEIDVGVFSPTAYIDAYENASVKLFLSQLVKGDQPKKTLIVLRKACLINTIDQIRGNSVAFTDPQSAYEYLYPRFQFHSGQKQSGLYFNKILVHSSQNQVFDAVLKGRIDSGIITYQDAAEVGGEDGIPIHELKTFVETEPVCYHAYACRQDLPDRLVKSIQAFFLTLKPMAAPLKTILSLPDALQFERWELADDSFADEIRGTLDVSKRKKKLVVLQFKPDTVEFYSQCLAGRVSRKFTEILVQANRFHVFARPVEFDQLEKLRAKLLVDIILTGSLARKDRQIILTVRGIDAYSGKVVIEQKKVCYNLARLDESVAALVENLQKEIPLEASVENVDHNLIDVNGGFKEGFAGGMSFVAVNFDGEGPWPIHLASAESSLTYRIVAKGRFKKVDAHSSIGQIEAGDMAQVNIGTRIQTVESNADGLKKKLSVYNAYLQGARHMGRGEFSAAVDAFQKCLAYDPAYAMASARLSTAYFNLKKTTLGLGALENAKKYVNPDMIQEKGYILAMEATEKKDYRAAIRFYSEILNRYPHNTTALHNLGLIYMDPGYEGYSYDIAVMYFQKTLAIDPALDITKSALQQACLFKDESIDLKAVADQKPLMDLVFVLDTTGSMQDKIPLIVQNAIESIDDLSRKQVDVRLGLVTFGAKVRQIYCPQPDYVPQLVTSTGPYKKWLKELFAHGGGDEDPYAALAAAMQYDFRPAARKVIILVTDESAHLDRPGRMTTDQLLAELSRKAATVFIIGAHEACFHEIADKTGGRFVNIRERIEFPWIVERARPDITGCL